MIIRIIKRKNSYKQTVMILIMKMIQIIKKIQVKEI